MTPDFWVFVQSPIHLFPVNRYLFMALPSAFSTGEFKIISYTLLILRVYDCRICIVGPWYYFSSFRWSGYLILPTSMKPSMMIWEQLKHGNPRKSVLPLYSSLPHSFLQVLHALFNLQNIGRKYHQLLAHAYGVPLEL